MVEKAPIPAHLQGDLHLEIQDEDWVAIRGTMADLEGLGELLIEFARSGAEGKDYAVLDSPSPRFRAGSLGIYLYRTI
jgi:hypothetical protein